MHDIVIRLSHSHRDSAQCTLTMRVHPCSFLFVSFQLQTDTVRWCDISGLRPSIRLYWDPWWSNDYSISGRPDGTYHLLISHCAAVHTRLRSTLMKWRWRFFATLNCIAQCCIYTELVPISLYSSWLLIRARVGAQLPCMCFTSLAIQQLHLYMAFGLFPVRQKDADKRTLGIAGEVYIDRSFQFWIHLSFR